jgi:hypothetical protein
MLMSDEATLYVTKDGCVKTVRITATVGENLVSTHKDTTSQPLQTAHQHTWWDRQVTLQIYASFSANSMQRQTLTYQTYSSKWISGFLDPVSNTVTPQFTKLFWINLWPWLVYIQKIFTNILLKKTVSIVTFCNWNPTAESPSALYNVICCPIQNLDH